MSKRRVFNRYLLAGVSLSGLLVTGTAWAQGAAADDAGIAEVVVTATRQVDTVSRVPLSIAAVTQRNLDEQGIKTAADLVRVVPGLNVATTPGSNLATFSIRGIVGGTGAATTSIYLDDSNITKRANGGVAQNNGVALPLLYDLERVEVLKGPQGTLYGGSSQGGTVRFITPQPSLTRYTGTARAEISSYGGRGELSHELGGAVGGPIVQDKLGFRISGLRRTTGGYVDVVSAYTNQMLREDANSTWEWAGRIAFLWQITDRASATASYYHTSTKLEGGPTNQTAIFTPDGNRAPANQTFTTTQRCVTGYRPATTPVAVAGGAPATAYIPVNAVCNTPTANALYVRPSTTYGPFTTGEDISLATGRQAIVGSDSSSDIASLTLNYDFETMNVKSITTYLHDQAASNTTGGEEWSSTAVATGLQGQSTTLAPTLRGFPLFAPFGGVGSTGAFIAGNKRYGIEQELRFSSKGDTRLTWVAGIYFSNLKTHIHYYYAIDPTVANGVQAAMYGPQATAFSRYGVPLSNFQADLEASITDTELAGFGEANFWVIPDRLKAIAGVRVSRVSLDYYQTNYGQFSGRLPSSIGSITQGKSTNSPVTPKFSLQYQITDQNMAYVTAAKGFRAGGVNPQISQTICEPFLTPLGITASDVPVGYDPDTVWSYELGGKFKLLNNKLQINIAGYRIDWKDVQATITLGCGQSFVTSGAKARSEGVDFQATYRPIRPLTLGMTFGYTNARYIDPVAGPLGLLPGQSPSLNAGDKFDVPPVQLSLNAQYDFNVGGVDSYLRVDYQYQGRYTAGATFGASGFGANYFNRNNPVRDQINIRAGVRLNNGLEINAFAQNLLNNDTQTGGFSNGRTCSATSPDCNVIPATGALGYTAYNPFVAQTFMRPRIFGVQANYRF